MKEEMQNIWNSSVPPQEKVKQLTEELNKFRSLLKTMTEPVKVQIHQQNETVKPSDNTSTQESTTNKMGLLFKASQKQIVKRVVSYWTS